MFVGCEKNSNNQSESDCQPFYVPVEFSATINGRSWEANCGGFGIETIIGTTDLVLAATSPDFEGIDFLMYDFIGPGTYIFENDSLLAITQAGYRTPQGNIYAAFDGNLTVTNYNSNEMSAIFNFRAHDWAGDTVVITNGTFSNVQRTN